MNDPNEYLSPFMDEHRVLNGAFDTEADPRWEALVVDLESPFLAGTDNYAPARETSDQPEPAYQNDAPLVMEHTDDSLPPNVSLLPDVDFEMAFAEMETSAYDEPANETPVEAILLQKEHRSIEVELLGETHSPAVDEESGNLQEKVRWYQAMLRIACGYPDVPVNGKHNDPATRDAMTAFQKMHRQEATGYLTVESNLALTQRTLEWMFVSRIDHAPGRPGPALANSIKKFQDFYGLSADGKVGPATRAIMVEVLQGQRRMPTANMHMILGSMGKVNAGTGEQISAPSQTGIIGEDNRVRVPDTLVTPFRHICRLTIIIQDPDNRDHQFYFHGTGVMITPKNVLTAAHNLYDWIVGSKGTRVIGDVTEIYASPGYSAAYQSRGRQTRHKDKVHRWFVPEEWKSEINKGGSSRKHDFALLECAGALGCGSSMRMDHWKVRQPIPASLYEEDVYACGYGVSSIGGDKRAPLLAAGKATFGDLATGHSRDFLGIRLDASPGMSGGPVWRTRLVRDPKTGVITHERDLLGIMTHVAHLHLNIHPNFGNYAKPLTSDVIDWLKARWIEDGD